MPPVRALEEGRLRFRSRDVDETRAFFALSGLRFDPIGSDQTLDVRLNREPVSGICVAFVQYGAAAVVRAERETAYMVKLPLRGGWEASSRHEVVSCSVRQGVVLSPTREYVMRAEAGATRLGIALKRDALAQQLAALLGSAPDTPLEFALGLRLNEGHGRSLARFARLAMAELERPDTVLLEPITARSFREFVMTALLLHQPHNYSDRLRRLARPVTPRDVKRAIEYIEANLDAAIGLPEIVAACGVPGRTLIQHFRDFKSTSPMRYLRTARFEKVREALSRAEPEESITEIAARWGFSHMGRFSVDYRRRFGESPSATLQRGRNAPTRPITQSHSASNTYASPPISSTFAAEYK
jgi:AraC-like DNA-binding protein